MKLRSFFSISLSLSLVFMGVLSAQKMLRENVVEVTAVGDGLCVSNAFQSNMVLQRDKPITIWGWAAAGEKVTVSFGGKSVEASADSKRAWEVTLPAVPANAEAQTLTVKSKSGSLTLENILVGDVWLLGGQSNMELSLIHI